MQTRQGGPEEQRSSGPGAVPQRLPHAQGRHPHSRHSAAARVLILQVHQASPRKRQPNHQVLCHA